MQRIVLVVLAVCIALIAAQSTTPILLFSKQTYFNSAKVHSHPVSNVKLNEVFTDLFTGTTEQSNAAILNTIESNNIPSTVLVWTQPGLTTQQSSHLLAMYTANEDYATVQNNLAMYLPNAVQQDSDAFFRSFFVSDEAKSLDIDANTTCQQITEFITASTAQTATKSHYLRVNGAELANFSKFNECLDAMNTTLESVSSGKYVTIVQGTQSMNSANTIAIAEDAAAPVLAATSATQRADGRAGPQYVSSQTLVALFAVFSLLAFLALAINRLMDIQGPLRYPTASHVPPATREY